MAKKREKSGLARLQKKADAQGIRLQQANGQNDDSDAAVMERMMKKGPLGRKQLM